MVNHRSWDSFEDVIFAVKDIYTRNNIDRNAFDKEATKLDTENKRLVEFIEKIQEHNSDRNGSSYRISVYCKEALENLGEKK